jgi:predicted metalloprotease
MDWKGRRQSDNIEDERGSSPMSGGGGGGFRFPGGGIGGGGLSFRTIIVLVVIFLILRAMGVDVIGLLQQSGMLEGGGSGYQQSTSNGSGGGQPANDEMKQFVATVLADTEDTWSGIFKSMGQTYTDPKLVLFSGRFPSACGQASAATGPFYCPSDQKVYLDMAFFQQMKDQFGASGDFAQAYVIAHEVGHHVQDLLGTLGQAEQLQARQSETEGNATQVKIELQADCYAGVWAANAKAPDGQPVMQQGDIEEGMRAAEAIGDDTLQRQAQGTVVPDSFTHGTSAQRMNALRTGYQAGNIDACQAL